MTPLHSAASHGAFEVAKLLIDSGCNIRCKDEGKMTPLHFAAMEGYLGNNPFKGRALK